MIESEGANNMEVSVSSERLPLKREYSIADVFSFEIANGMRQISTGNIYLPGQFQCREFTAQALNFLKQRDFGLTVGKYIIALPTDPTLNTNELRFSQISDLTVSGQIIMHSACIIDLKASKNSKHLLAKLPENLNFLVLEPQNGRLFTIEHARFLYSGGSGSSTQGIISQSEVETANQRALNSNDFVIIE